MATRDGRPLDAAALRPRPDGGPPPIYDGNQSFLLAEARKALDDAPLAPGESIDFIQCGSAQTDGSFATSSYSVDSEGRVFWISSRKRILIGQLDATSRST